MSRKTLIELSTRHQVMLERLKTSEARSFSAVLTQVEAQILALLNKKDFARASELKKRELDALIVQLEQLQEKLLTDNADKFMGNLKEIADSEVHFETRAMTSTLSGAISNLAGKLVVPTMEQAFKAALAQPISATGTLLEPFIQGWSERQMEGVNAAVRRAWAEGRTMQQLVQEIRGTKLLNYQDGLINASRRQAEAIARTAVQHVSSSSRFETWEKNKDLVKGYIWVSTLDGKTTQVCRSLDGQKFPLDQGPRPPIHVGCRSTTIADLGPEFDFLDEGATRSSKDGYVKADQTYYDWLKTQPETFVKQALGASRAELFLKGGLSADEFAKLNLNRNFEPMTLEQMKAAAPAVFTRAGLN